MKIKKINKKTEEVIKEYDIQSGTIVIMEKEAILIFNSNDEYKKYITNTMEWFEIPAYYLNEDEIFIFE